METKSNIRPPTEQSTPILASRHQVIAASPEVSPDTRRGYKIVDSQLRGRNQFQFVVGKVAAAYGKLLICSNGLHFCYDAINCVKYSCSLKRPNRYLQVVPVSAIACLDDKSATLNLLVEKELTAAEWLAQVRIEYKRTKNSFDALKIGIIEHDIDMIELALSDASLARTKSTIQATAAMCGDVTIMKFLASRGMTNCCTALPFAVDHGYLPVVEFLLEAEDVSPQRSRDIEIALFRVVETDRVDIASALIAALSANDAPDDSVRGLESCLDHALSSAAKSNNLPMVKCLVKRGATNIYRAACLGGKAVIEYLVSTPNFDLKTAICYADERDQLVSMRYFQALLKEKTAMLEAAVLEAAVLEAAVQAAGDQ